MTRHTRRSFLLSIAVAAAGVPACAPRAPRDAAAGPTPEATRRVDSAVRAALGESAAGWNRADLDAHLAMYGDSATFMTGAGPIVGRARTRATLERAFWRDGRPVQQLRFERVAVRPLGTGHALATGRFVLSGGGAPERSGWFTLAWARTAAGWRVVHDHSS